jgi:hypothetical protein
MDSGSSEFGDVVLAVGAHSSSAVPFGCALEIWKAHLRRANTMGLGMKDSPVAWNPASRLAGKMCLGRRWNSEYPVLNGLDSRRDRLWRKSDSSSSPPRVVEKLSSSTEDSLPTPRAKSRRACR